LIYEIYGVILEKLAYTNGMRLLMLTILCSLFIVLASPIVAQEASSSATPSSSGVTFEQLKSDYLFQLEKYREAQEVFNLDKAEFDKLQTLTAREEAVSSMKPYLVLRDCPRVFGSGFTRN
jgi:hypothetical protein